MRPSRKKRIGMTRGLVTVVLAALISATVLAQGPATTELPGKIFAIQKTWVIGGEGNWDYLTMDPLALLLYVAHGSQVQIVDLGTGTLAGVVGGMRDAHGIALDPSSNAAFVSDGPSNEVKVFDRTSQLVTATVRVGPNPRAIVFDPATRLVFAICTEEVPTTPGQIGTGTRQTAHPPAHRQPNGQTYDPELRSVISVIDADRAIRLADILLPGKLGFAQADGNGLIYVNITDRNQVARIDAKAIDAEVRQQPHSEETSTAPHSAATSVTGSHSDAPRIVHAALTVDWSDKIHVFPLGAGCVNPRGLAVDANRARLFAACDNSRMQVINSHDGTVVATLPTGAGTDAIAYDANRGLIFTSNGGDLGSVTVIRQSVTDGYAVIQNLPTRQRARTLALNDGTGEVYVVTNLSGFDLSKPGTGGDTHTLPVVQATPVKGSFQVLVIGN